MHGQLKQVLGGVAAILKEMRVSQDSPVLAKKITDKLETAWQGRNDIDYLFGVYAHLAKDGYLLTSDNKAILFTDGLKIFGLSDKAALLLTPWHKRKSFWKKFPMVVISLFMLGGVLYHLSQNM